MITNAIELHVAIQKLEADRVIQGYLLQQEFEHIYDRINPLSRMRDSLNGSPTSHLQGNNLISTTIGLATGYLVKKWIIGKSANPVKAMIGSAIQVGIINLMTRYEVSIETIGRTLLQLMLPKEKKTNAPV